MEKLPQQLEEIARDTLGIPDLEAAEAAPIRQALWNAWLAGNAEGARLRARHPSVLPDHLRLIARAADIFDAQADPANPAHGGLPWDRLRDEYRDWICRYRSLERGAE